MTTRKMNSAKKLHKKVYHANNLVAQNLWDPFDFMQNCFVA